MGSTAAVARQALRTAEAERGWLVYPCTSSGDWPGAGPAKDLRARLAPPKDPGALAAIQAPEGQSPPVKVRLSRKLGKAEMRVTAVRTAESEVGPLSTHS
eukprot:g13851.t1